jgi:hypothetical protein
VAAGSIPLIVANELKVKLCTTLFATVGDDITKDGQLLHEITPAAGNKSSTKSAKRETGDSQWTN